MKKIFFAFLFCACIFSANALGGDHSSKTLCLGISFPLIANDYKIDDFDLEKLNAVGINLNARKMGEDRKVGIFLDADIFMPYSRVIIWDDKYQTTTTLSDYDYFFGTDVIAGFYTSIFRDGTINLPMGAGLHLDGFVSKRSSKKVITKESAYTSGIGAWANIEVTVSKRLGIYAGSKFVYDFYYKSSRTRTSTASSSRDGKCKGFTFAPAVGMLLHL